LLGSSLFTWGFLYGVKSKVENTFNGELKDDLASLKTGSEHGTALKA